MDFAPCPRCYQMNPPSAVKCEACGAAMDEAPVEVAPLALKEPEPEPVVEAQEVPQPAAALPGVARAGSPAAPAGSAAPPTAGARAPAAAVPPLPPTAAAPHQAAPTGAPAVAAPASDAAAQVSSLEEQIAARPQAKALYLKLADLHQHAGQKDAAIRALERLLGVDPGNALAKHRIDVLRGTVHHAPPVTAVHPVTRPPRPVARPVGRRSSRRRLWIGLGALAVVLIAGVFWFFSGPTRLAAGRGPVFSPQGNRIAYFTDAGGGATLNVYDLKSGRSRALGRASGFGSAGDAVAWSPDGRQVAFTAPGEGEFGPESVFVADVESGARRELATGSSPTWSPDGLSIGMFCHEPPQVLSTAEDGEFPTAFGPGWDGVCLVSVADGSIRRLHEGTGNRLAFSPRSPTLVLERFPEEVPDDAVASGGGADDELQALAEEAVAGGATNVYEGSRDLGRAIEARGLDKRGSAAAGYVVGDLFAVDADSGSLAALSDDGRSANPRWTAEGRIVYVHQPPGATRAELWVMEADGRGKQPLVKAPVELFDPDAVGVGGDRVVYAGPIKDVNAGMAKIMTGEEAADLHVVRLGGGEARRLENRHTFKQRFALSPDGRRIVYEANDRKSGESELWLMKP